MAEATNPVDAAIWVDALHDAGIEASSFERGVGAALGGAMTPGWVRYPIVVPAADLAGARNVVAGLGGATALAPIDDPERRREQQSRILRLLGVAIAAVIVAGLLARFVL